MEQTKKSEDRLAVLARIAEFEAAGTFDKDVEIDPPWQPLDLTKADLLKKKPINKLKSHIATFLGWRFFERSLRKKQWIFAGCSGIDNLDGFSGGAFVTCNHFSHFDNYAVYISLKKYFKKFRLHKIIREGNYSYKGLLGFLLRHGDTIPIGEGHRLLNACIKTCGELLNRGKKILIYPEQCMWWNYPKPRPLKKGAFLFAAKYSKPIIPCFITLKDSDLIGADGFKVKEYTVHILPLIYPDPSLSTAQNCEIMQQKNAELWQKCYQDTYQINPDAQNDGANGAKDA